MHIFFTSVVRDKKAGEGEVGTHIVQHPSEEHTEMEKISNIFDQLQKLSSPEEWLEQRRQRTMLACRQVLMDQACLVSYGKTVEGGPESPQKQKDKAEFFRRMFDGILKSIPLASYSTSPCAARNRRFRRNRRACKRGRVVFNYEHERNHVPVICRNNTAVDFPSVSKLPALNTDALRGVSKSIEDFVNRFPGVNVNRYGHYFNFAHEAMFYPGPILLKWSMGRNGFQRVARNIFINTRTKTTLVFLGGVESYRQVDMLFSAAVGAIPGMARRVGMAECIAFYPDLMCAEYDFIGLGLKELLQDNRYDITDIKINCIDEDRKYDVFQYRKDLINRMPFIFVEICNLAQRLINNGLAITKATDKNFAVDIKDDTRPVLAILDCLSPLGYDFKTSDRQVEKTQLDATLTQWSEEIGEEVAEQNYPLLSEEKNETFYHVPPHIVPSCAPEITNVSIFSGGSTIDIYSDVSEATEASTAYVIGKVLEETLSMAKLTSSYDEASVVSPTKSLLLSNEIINIVTIMCSDAPEMRCPVSFLSRVMINFMNVILLTRSETLGVKEVSL